MTSWQVFSGDAVLFCSHYKVGKCDLVSGPMDQTMTYPSSTISGYVCLAYCYDVPLQSGDVVKRVRKSTNGGGLGGWMGQEDSCLCPV